MKFDGFGGSNHAGTQTAEERTVVVATGSVALEGSMAVPDAARGVVVFAHGSGSSRHSPRNRYVAEELRAGGLGTLLVDLLTPNEEIIGRDDVVIDLNKRAMAQMTAPARLEIVPGATHLFDEPGTLEDVARLARDWFLRHLGQPTQSGASSSVPDALQGGYHQRGET